MFLYWLIRFLVVAKLGCATDFGGLLNQVDKFIIGPRISVLYVVDLLRFNRELKIYDDDVDENATKQ